MLEARNFYQLIECCYSKMSRLSDENEKNIYMIFFSYCPQIILKFYIGILQLQSYDFLNYCRLSILI